MLEENTCSFKTQTKPIQQKKFLKRPTVLKKFKKLSFKRKEKINKELIKKDIQSNNETKNESLQKENKQKRRWNKKSKVKRNQNQEGNLVDEKKNPNQNNYQEFMENNSYLNEEILLYPKETKSVNKKQNGKHFDGMENIQKWEFSKNVEKQENSTIKKPKSKKKWRLSGKFNSVLTNKSRQSSKKKQVLGQGKANPNQKEKEMEQKRRELEFIKEALYFTKINQQNREKELLILQQKQMKKEKEKEKENESDNENENENEKGNQDKEENKQNKNQDQTNLKLKFNNEEEDNFFKQKLNITSTDNLNDFLNSNQLGVSHEFAQLQKNKTNETNETKVPNEIIQTNETNKQDFNEKPKHLWLASVMKSNPQLLELRERSRNLTGQMSFGRLYKTGKTESKQQIGGEKMLTQMLIEYLESEGLCETSQTLQEESKTQRVYHYKKNDQLTSLLYTSVQNVGDIWNVNKDNFVLDQGFDRDVVQIQNRSTKFLMEDDELIGLNIWEEPEDSENNIIYLEKENEIRAATFNKSLEKITEDEKYYDEFSKIFLMTYQSFTTPGKLLYKIFQRIKIPKKINDKMENAKVGGGNYKEKIQGIKKQTYAFLYDWINHHFSDFNEGLIEELNHFINKSLRKNRDIKHIQILRKTIDDQQLGKKKHFISSNNIQPPEPSVPKNIFSKTLTLFDINELEIARQISIIDFEIFSKIQPSELLNCAWAKEKLKHRAKNLLQLIDRFNHMSLWVSTLIIKPERVRDRAKVYTKFVKILGHLYQLNNFHSLMSITAGLSASAVHRLSFTRNEVKDTVMDKFQTLQNIMISKDSYKNYRKELKNLKPPCVPFIGIYQTDLTFIEDGNPDYINENLINFSKRKLVYDVIHRIQYFQSSNYNLHPVYQIAHFLNHFHRLDKNELYEWSLKREPRNSTKNDIKY
ncbi:ras guanine nucleotide exchange factor i-related [Anaeramoeba flamelloides]|uniref:Ras guanine nucleotide exchange factor i-related n=1 Tax=Anaeramoeba flamelloides TaxID=1746091 RepID=A0ABQ8Z0C3_9EUKA|nr:ras guanine nucleotide exchange factor i-related [Anaeramoeba flamelloides]